MAVDVAAQIKEAIVEKLGVEASKITENVSFINDLGADSLDTVELIMELENRFNIQYCECNIWMALGGSRCGFHCVFCTK